MIIGNTSPDSNITNNFLGIKSLLIKNLYKVNKIKNSEGDKDTKAKLACSNWLSPSTTAPILEGNEK
ncbi:MAG: hypothetical protein BroJett025_07570 [Patescibacteria group bacterium]|nr:MAG: hypothetical protein BroJett025_07570 [Patescibacteria group bacterium]